MRHIKKNNKVQILLKKDDSVIYGTIFDFNNSKIKVAVNEECVNIAKNADKSDKVYVSFDTAFGDEEMEGCITHILNNNIITIENNPEVPVAQKRAFVRVISQFDFTAFNKNSSMPIVCSCINISGGGIAFKTKEDAFKKGDIVEISLPESIFERTIRCEIEILKVLDFGFTARFLNLSMHNEDRIVKHIFKLMSTNARSRG